MNGNKIGNYSLLILPHQSFGFATLLSWASELLYNLSEGYLTTRQFFKVPEIKQFNQIIVFSQR